MVKMTLDRWVTIMPFFSLHMRANVVAIPETAGRPQVVLRWTQDGSHRCRAKGRSSTLGRHARASDRVYR